LLIVIVNIASAVLDLLWSLYSGQSAMRFEYFIFA